MLQAPINSVILMRHVLSWWQSRNARGHVLSGNRSVHKNRLREVCKNNDNNNKNNNNKTGKIRYRFQQIQSFMKYCQRSEVLSLFSRLSQSESERNVLLYVPGSMRSESSSNSFSLTRSAYELSCGLCVWTK